MNDFAHPDFIDFTIYDELDRVAAVIRQAELSSKDRQAGQLEHTKVRRRN